MMASLLSRRWLALVGLLGGAGYALYTRHFFSQIDPEVTVPASAVLAQMLFNLQFVTYWVLPTMLIWTNITAPRRLQLPALVRHGSRRRALMALLTFTLTDAAVLVAGAIMGAGAGVVGLAPVAPFAGQLAHTPGAWLATMEYGVVLVPLLAIVLLTIGLATIALALSAWAAMPERRLPGLALSAVAIWLWAIVALYAGGAAIGAFGPVDLLLFAPGPQAFLDMLPRAGACVALVLVATALVSRADER